MSVRRLIATAVLGGSLLVPLSALAQGDRGSCSLGGMYRVLSVDKYEIQDKSGYTMERELRGAEVEVAAQPGLTREWLQRRLEMEVANGTCDLGAPNVRVDVLSSGDRFSVRFSGTDRKTAGAILDHARLFGPQ